MNTYSNRVEYIRDEIQKKQEAQLLTKLAEIASGFEEKSKEPSQENQPSQVRFVGIEDALKELLSFSKP